MVQHDVYIFKILYLIIWTIIQASKTLIDREKERIIFHQHVRLYFSMNSTAVEGDIRSRFIEMWCWSRPILKNTSQYWMEWSLLDPGDLPSESRWARQTWSSWITKSDMSSIAIFQDFHPPALEPFKNHLIYIIVDYQVCKSSESAITTLAPSLYDFLQINLTKVVKHLIFYPSLVSFISLMNRMGE